MSEVRKLFSHCYCVRCCRNVSPKHEKFIDWERWTCPRCGAVLDSAAIEDYWPEHNSEDRTNG